MTYLYNTLFYYERRLSAVPLLKRRLVNAIIGQLSVAFIVCVSVGLAMLTAPSSAMQEGVGEGRWGGGGGGGGGE